MVEFAKYFVGSVMPYIAALVFVVGIIYRIVRWYQAPVRYEIIVFPAP